MNLISLDILGKTFNLSLSETSFHKIKKDKKQTNKKHHSVKTTEAHNYFLVLSVF